MRCYEFISHHPHIPHSLLFIAVGCTIRLQFYTPSTRQSGQIRIYYDLTPDSSALDAIPETAIGSRLQPHFIIIFLSFIPMYLPMHWTTETHLCRPAPLSIFICEKWNAASFIPLTLERFIKISWRFTLNLNWRLAKQSVATAHPIFERLPTPKIVTAIRAHLIWMRHVCVWKCSEEERIKKKKVNVNLQFLNVGMPECFRWQ